MGVIQRIAEATDMSRYRRMLKRLLVYLIPEAWSYLVISVNTRAAEQLLPDLRGLWQCVEVAFLQSAQAL